MLGEVSRVSKFSPTQIEPDPIDICMVIGTSVKVWPAAGYMEFAPRKGARVAVVNIHVEDAKKTTRTDKDWVFVGDAAVVILELLKPVIGEIHMPHE